MRRETLHDQLSASLAVTPGRSRRKSPPVLKVAANDDPHAEIHAELREALLALSKLRVQVAAAEQRLLAARMAHKEAHNLLVMPRVEVVQQQFGPGADA